MRTLIKTIRRPAVFALALLFTICIIPATVSAKSLYDLPAGTAISSKAAILVSLGASEKDDLTLFELNADEKRSPAALVRLMVGITAIKSYAKRVLTLKRQPANTLTRPSTPSRARIWRPRAW